MAEINPTCPICCDIYNATSRKKITCLFGDCNFEACKTCMRTYLISNKQDPNCMKCKKAYDTEFLLDNLNPTWVKGEYKKHRQQLLLDEAISKLPEAQPEVIRLNNISKQKEYIKEQEEQIAHLVKHLNKQKNTLWKLQNKKDTPTQKFIMGCPNNECKGFLSTSYKCELCNLHTCPQCLCIIGDSKDHPHQCSPDAIASANLIKAETKPCPCCGERISKISGCDQMWCTACQTPFSWRTGQIVTGPVHNPHFFEYEANQTTNHHNNALGQCNAEGLPNYQLMNRIINTILKKTPEENDEDKQNNIYTPSLGEQLRELYRFISHIKYDELPNSQTKIDRLTDTMDLRVNYLKNNITKERMAQKLYLNDKNRVLQTKIHHIFELIDRVGSETLWGIVNFPEDDKPVMKATIDKEINKLFELLVYCNKQFEDHSFNNKCQSYLIRSNVFKNTTLRHRVGLAAQADRVTYRFNIDISKECFYKLYKDQLEAAEPQYLKRQISIKNPSTTFTQALPPPPPFHVP